MERQWASKDLMDPNGGRGNKSEEAKFIFWKEKRQIHVAPKDRMEETRGSQFEPLILRRPATEMPNGGRHSLGE